MMVFTVHMHEEEAFVHKGVHDRKEYRKKWMQEKRAKERLQKESEEDRIGEVSLACVEKEAVSEAEMLRTEMASQEIEFTETDVKFEEKSPGYWIYGKEVKERKCWQCGKPYETRLELNKFCSPKCKEKWLSDAFGKLRGVKSDG